MIGVLLVFLAALLWAIDTLIRYPLMNENFSALFLVFLEHLILIILFVPYLLPRFNNYTILLKKYWKEFLVIGGLGSAGATICFSKAFVYLNPSVVILMQKLQPVIVVILARFILKERISSKFVFWCAISLVGALLISVPSLKFGPGLASDVTILGILLTLFSVLAWGASTVFAKKLTLAELNSFEIMIGRYLFAFLVLLPLISLLNTFDSATKFSLGTLDLESFGKILLIVLISGITAMWFYYQGLRKLPAHVCAIAEMFFPFSAVCINWIFLKQELLPIQLLGGVLLILSATVIQIKKY